MNAPTNGPRVPGGATALPPGVSFSPIACIARPRWESRELVKAMVHHYVAVMASPACSICQRPDLPDIDAALAAGTTIMAAAAHHGTSKSALGRHKLNCLAPKLAAAAKMVQSVKQGREHVERAKAIIMGQQPVATDLLSLNGLLDRLARSLERLEGAADTAAGDNLHAALAAVSGQLHRGIEVAGKLQGLYAEPETQRQAPFSITINLPSTPEISNAVQQITGEGRASETRNPPSDPVGMRLEFNPDNRTNDGWN